MKGKAPFQHNPLSTIERQIKRRLLGLIHIKNGWNFKNGMVRLIENDVDPDSLSI